MPFSHYTVLSVCGFLIHSRFTNLQHRPMWRGEACWPSPEVNHGTSEQVVHLNVYIQIHIKQGTHFRCCRQHKMHKVQSVAGSFFFHLSLISRKMIIIIRSEHGTGYEDVWKWCPLCNNTQFKCTVYDLKQWNNNRTILPLFISLKALNMLNMLLMIERGSYSHALVTAWTMRFSCIFFVFKTICVQVKTALSGRHQM